MAVNRGRSASPFTRNGRREAGGGTMDCKKIPLSRLFAKNRIRAAISEKANHYLSISINYKLNHRQNFFLAGKRAYKADFELAKKYDEVYGKMNDQRKKGKQCV
ncbi:hypothetical protein BCV53_14010 [Parageobacillus thermoglucosidasius]|uniref:Uncharacterized protein n=2 Tax=Anoxybacillaceae TaxID=3120669 RepID=A0AAN1D7H1_PARTM|nr:hypothetical protein Geoth_1761 [Parageobacillus thermoglucosidasius C56-YS93]ALF11033.1 hypothetical protein AOT13_13995 [Parageobacillus thermoglucosidasius]EID44776.1 hypothetical protein GT20_1516 [Parageobacillus thermoglucosidasius TNO-09.020]KYD16721.1 Pterin-4-alpha-carbinolamine dehydratase [Anoxybacillus flavithermus]REK58076.1 MAG: hypothetical protein C6P36_04715 [Geobacillus sp.]GAJ42777.1 hypothetical protein GT2_05_00020 [Parageobacillus thermoglucosidasius NBRC 107763]